MSIDRNASLIPSMVKTLVAMFAAIATVGAGVVYMFDKTAGHFLWFMIGGFLVLVAVYLFLLRMKPPSA
jgi:F0F1-type ATP synthase assembly protein I